MPVHVLTITPFYPRDGNDAQGCFVAEPLRWTKQIGIKNTVVAVQPFYRASSRRNVSAFPAEWNRYFSFPSGWGLPTAGSFLFARLLRKVRKEHQYHPIHLIHAHAALPCGHAAALLSRELKVPFVVTVHGLDVFFTTQVSGHAGAWCRRIAQWVYRSADRVICISERVRERVLEGARANAVVIYNGVDPEKFKPGPDTLNTILSVGNLIPIKGHELLLRALAAVEQRFPTVSCTIIGAGPERPRLELLTRDLGLTAKVRFLGHQNRNQVADAMRQCSIFALPSRYEGLGCVYLEAMASGKPVIGCRGQGIEEVIQHGRNGWLIGPDDLPDMTDALSQLLQDPYTRRQMGEAARQTVLQGFTYAHQAEMLTRLYHGCLA